MLRDGRMPSQREWCPPEPLDYQELCSGCDCTAPEAAPWRSWKHLELSSLPTAVLGNFPQPEVFEDLSLKPSPKNHCQINTAEHQAVAAYPHSKESRTRPWMDGDTSATTKLTLLAPEFLIFLWPFLLLSPSGSTCASGPCPTHRGDAWERKLTPFKNWMSKQGAGAKFNAVKMEPLRPPSDLYCSVFLPSLFIHLKEYHLWEAGGERDVLLSYSLELWENKENTSSHSWACWALLVLFWESSNLLEKICKLFLALWPWKNFNIMCVFVWNLSVGELSCSKHGGLLYEAPIVCWVKLTDHSVSGYSLKWECVVRNWR